GRLRLPALPAPGSGRGGLGSTAEPRDGAAGDDDERAARHATVDPDETPVPSVDPDAERIEGQREVPAEPRASTGAGSAARPVRVPRARSRRARG
uniref:hypothetical protein n=1 Tax=uncultured Micrococcus sp. TaxID=114051 RepID=UPI0025CF7BFD